MCVFCVSRCRMSSAAEDEDAAALETVKSVTLTQDSDGSIILHCPANGWSEHTCMQVYRCYRLYKMKRCVCVCR